MEDVEKFEIKIKTFVVLFLFGFISFVAFLFIGIAKVDAQSYTWTSPFMVQGRYATSSTNNVENGTLYVNGRYTTFVESVDSESLITQWNVRYSVTTNTSNDDTAFAKDSYAISLKFRVVTWTTSTTPNLSNFKLWYYRSANGVYKTMTCDSGETFSYSKNGSSGADYTISYYCARLDFNQADITHIAYTYYDSKVGRAWQNVSNFYMVGLTTDATNNDIISNQNSNAEAIINNQNQNTEDIINNQNSNTDKVIDSIEGDGLTNDTPLDESTKNDYESAEDKLMNEDNLNYINDIDIALDSNSSDFIWDLITRILNTHALVFGAMITILSLGIIKLVLNR